jgi:hypothetical protein
MTTPTTVKCALPTCGKEFEGRKGKSYCSNTCRSKASIIRTSGLSGTGQVPMFAEKEKETTATARKPTHINVSHGVSAIEAQLLMKEVDRWEDAYKQERTRRKKREEELEKLKNELVELKTDQKIKTIEAENKKPSGLDGILESPLGQYIGPALGKLAERLVDAVPMGAAQLTGADASGNEALTQIANWFLAQAPDVQETFYHMVNEFAGKSPDELKIKMGYIKNLLNYGTTATGTNG